MNLFSVIEKFKKPFSRYSSLLLLFQRSPIVQMLFPEAKLLTSAAFVDTTKFVITTVVGLGAFDSVAGATSVSQVAPAAGSATVPVTAGTNLAGVFQVVGGGGHTPQSWSVSSGTLPNGLTLANSRSKTTTLTGTTTQTGNHVITIRGWENSNFSGRSAQASFTLQVSAGAGAAIGTHPASTSISSGSTATLTVTATGGAPLTYQWYEGASGVTTQPVGTNAASFTTPNLTATKSYWVRVSNAANPAGVQSNTATVTVLQPAAIVEQPVSTQINSGQSTTLSVVASGDGPLTYQWYQGVSGVITTPVGTNAASFTTPSLLATTSYWVRISNTALPAGVDSSTATVSVTAPAEPTILTASPLATGFVGSLYSTSMSVIGGTGPYTWRVSEGVLPAGLTLSEQGLLSGTPQSSSSSSFTVEVEDAAARVATKVFTLTLTDLVIRTASLPTAVKGVAFSHSLLHTGGTGPYTWEIASGAPPAGITLSSAGVLSGTPTASGSATFTVRLTDGSPVVLVKALTLPVSATYLAPIVDPVVFSPTTLGALVNQTVTASNYPKTFAITGLPKGLTFVASTGVIKGRATVPGRYDVQVRASNAGGVSAVVVAPWVVNALDTHQVGNFTGLIKREAATNKGLGGTFSLTTTSLGAYTLKLTGALPTSGAAAAGMAYSAKGFLNASAPHVSVVLGGQTLTLNLQAGTGEVTGQLGAAMVNGWRNAWHVRDQPATPFVGYYSLALDLQEATDRSSPTIPHGTGFATFSVTPAGTLILLGKTADGETIMGSSFLSSQGQFGVYTPLYKKLGSLQGELLLDLQDAGSEDNVIRGALSWFKPTTVSRTYPASFGDVPLTAAGAYLAVTSKTKAILGLPAVGNVTLDLTGGGLAFSATDPRLQFTFTAANKVVLPIITENPGKVALTITPGTGKVSGSFTLVETSPLLTRAKVPFVGQVVRLADGSVKAVGYFLLPQIPQANQKATTTPILSGAFSLLQEVP
ncbi:hypothetical protein GCM10023213_41640 [Prosthecobacter algae]|uniref:Immunoglobulin domain-containing protein n=1 Tax=Prosthecobacter algae TaxID=1144682 RepID=A0ABP9PMF8_9BACT